MARHDKGDVTDVKGYPGPTVWIGRAAENQIKNIYY